MNLFFSFTKCLLLLYRDNYQTRAPILPTEKKAFDPNHNFDRKDHVSWVEFGQDRGIMMLYVRKLEFWVEEGGGRVVHTYSGNRVTIDVLPRGPLTLLIIRSITIKQGIHTDRAYNWLTMAQHVKDDNPSTGRTRKGQRWWEWWEWLVFTTLFQFLPRSGSCVGLVWGFIASSPAIGRTSSTWQYWRTN